MFGFWSINNGLSCIRPHMKSLYKCEDLESDYNEKLPQNCFPNSPESLTPHLERQLIHGLCCLLASQPGQILVFITLQTDFCPRPAQACKVTPHHHQSAAPESVTPCLKPQHNLTGPRLTSCHHKNSNRTFCVCFSLLAPGLNIQYKLLKRNSKVGVG